jgi:hypothetical protein
MPGFGLTPERLPEGPTHLHTTIDSIIRSVAELPDRTSPEHDPTQMTVTESELRDILWRHLDHFA